MLHSLSAQITYYSALIQNHNGWQYVGVYADEAVTGTKAERHDFQRLLEDCRTGKIDMVITKSISRFARNTVTLLETVRELKAIGVDVYFEEQNIHTLSNDGELMLTILASYAQEESLSVSENKKWQIRKNYEQGIPNTFAILGYDNFKGQLIVNKKEAEVVKLIFSEYLKGRGKLYIANMLNDLGVDTKFGNNWDGSKVKEILQNEKYVGDLLLQKTYVLEHLEKKTVKNQGELPKYYIRDNHIGIIDRGTFDNVQSEIKRRSQLYVSNRNIVDKSIFRGKIICGICGKNYTRKINNCGTKYEKVVWICATYNTKGKRHCQSQQIPEDILLKLVSNNIKQITVPSHFTIDILLNDGTEITKNWENPSRSDSWTDEMKQAVRERNLKQRRKST
jgi:DNA invertase Pin-like site-specific DNA recombinase